MQQQRTVYFFIISLLITNAAFAQNYSGTWTGTANWGLRKFKMELEIFQDGNTVTGIAVTSNLNNNNFIKYEFSGEILNNVAFARGIKVLEKKGITHCMPGFALTIYEGKPNHIDGKWKANTGPNSCLIPGTGGISLNRDEPLELEASRVIAIAEEDKRGNALSSQLLKQKYHGLFIAVQDYKGESVIDLNQPVSDARELLTELKYEYNFNEEDLIFLENPDRATIIETFDLLTKKVSENDNFLIFYAGHGIWDEDIEQGYWLPSDAKKSSKAAWLSNGTIRDYIRAIDSKHTLLITDACFSGGILKTREAFTASKAMLEMYKLPSRKAMTSGALKTVPDKSVFIEYLIKALKSNEQPLISADQLFTTFKYNVINNSPNGQVPQYGVISQADDEGGEFIFLKK